MKIKLNPDQEIVSTIREGLKRTGGYCPCRRESTERPNVCARSLRIKLQIRLRGILHCMLYYKSLQD